MHITVYKASMQNLIINSKIRVRILWLQTLSKLGIKYSITCNTNTNALQV